MNLILKAASFAEHAHRGQTRRNGTPYVHHPMRVAGRVSMLPGTTEELVAAAWLHDVLEDTKAKLIDLETEFGPKVLKLVIELTNVSTGLALPRAERKRLDREHIAKVSVEAKRIKMLDRIDNLNDMNGYEKDFVLLYTGESKLLADAIGDADRDLKSELLMIIEKLREWRQHG